MARRLADAELVAQTAETIIAEGGEPSIKAVQSRIGGGSYTTVKRSLDAWRENRTMAGAAAQTMPPELQGRALEFAGVIWSAATRLANEKTQQLEQQTLAKVAAARAELAAALSEVERLEHIESDNIGTIEQLHQQQRQLELELAEARASAGRVKALEQALASSQTEVAKKAEEAARLRGESESLRTQLKELIAALAAAGHTSAKTGGASNKTADLPPN